MVDNFRTFQEVVKRDAELFKLATYEVTGGMLVTPESLEDMMDLQKRVANQFNCFKKQIQAGETTFEYVTQQVLARNGAYPRDDMLVNESTIDEILNNADDSYAQYKTIERRARMDEQLKDAGNFLFSLAMNSPEVIDFEIPEESGQDKEDDDEKE